MAQTDSCDSPIQNGLKMFEQTCMSADTRKLKLLRKGESLVTRLSADSISASQKHQVFQLLGVLPACLAFLGSEYQNTSYMAEIKLH